MHSLATVKEVWLFGSRARADSDDGSDVDLLVVCDDRELPPMITQRLVDLYGDHVDIAHYSYKGLVKLVEQRTLFAWHLRREGVPIESKTDRLTRMLADMEPYDGHARDLGVLKAVFDDAVASLSNGWATRFDLGVVGTVIRNSGIIMHDLFGSWDFSPTAPLRLGSIDGAPGLPINSETYAYLCACRRASERGGEVDGREVGGLNQWSERLEQVAQWLGECLGCAKIGVNGQ